ncbi:MAG TPA: hypothetical protein DCL77_14805 [Prolixibacteraceae bacterium]|jgi:hypothetical protein|nr:hypothetical protein [Prolixibacteraceae bacterium]
MKNILLFMAMALLLAACKKDVPKPKIDYLKLYKAPNYPKKAAGRFLKSVSSQPIEQQSNLNSPSKNGVKAEFFYNAKNYVNFFKVYGSGADSIGRMVRIEYNISGLVSRIKYFDLDSVIVAYELFEYSTAKQLTRISRYELANDQATYGLASFNKFSYPTKDKIQELLYSKDMNFDHPFRDIYNYNAKGNVQEKIHYAYDAKFPSSSDSLFYDTKKRPYENLGLPVYEMNFGDFQRAEIFSKNNTIAHQNYTYDNSIDLIKVGGKQSYDLKYDTLDYPVSRYDSIRNETIYYNYIDLF